MQYNPFNNLKKFEIIDEVTGTVIGTEYAESTAEAVYTFRDSLRSVNSGTVRLLLEGFAPPDDVDAWKLAAEEVLPGTWWKVFTDVEGGEHNVTAFVNADTVEEAEKKYIEQAQIDDNAVGYVLAATNFHEYTPLTDGRVEIEIMPGGYILQVGTYAAGFDDTQTDELAVAIREYFALAYDNLPKNTDPREFVEKMLGWDENTFPYGTWADDEDEETEYVRAASVAELAQKLLSCNLRDSLALALLAEDVAPTWYLVDTRDYYDPQGGGVFVAKRHLETNGSLLAFEPNYIGFFARGDKQFEAKLKAYLFHLESAPEHRQWSDYLVRYENAPDFGNETKVAPGLVAVEGRAIISYKPGLLAIDKEFIKAFDVELTPEGRLPVHFCSFGHSDGRIFLKVVAFSEKHAVAMLSAARPDLKGQNVIGIRQLPIVERDDVKELLTSLSLEQGSIEGQNVDDILNMLETWEFATRQHPLSNAVSINCTKPYKIFSNSVELSVRAVRLVPPDGNPTGETPIRFMVS